MALSVVDGALDPLLFFLILRGCKGGFKQGDVVCVVLGQPDLLVQIVRVLFKEGVCLLFLLLYCVAFRFVKRCAFLLRQLAVVAFQGLAAFLDDVQYVKDAVCPVDLFL